MLLKHFCHTIPLLKPFPHAIAKVRTFCLFPMTHIKDSFVQYTCFSTLNVDSTNIGKQNIRVLLVILIISMTKKIETQNVLPKKTTETGCTVSLFHANHAARVAGAN